MVRLNVVVWLLMEYIAVYIKELLLSHLTKADPLVTLCDESYNRVEKKAKWIYMSVFEMKMKTW